MLKLFRKKKKDAPDNKSLYSQKTVSSRTPSLTPTSSLSRLPTWNSNSSSSRSSRGPLQFQSQWGLPSFSWTSLDTEITSGKLLIVAKGLVYDVADWIARHPGGVQVIANALGTDVTNDVYNARIDFDRDALNWKSIKLSPYDGSLESVVKDLEGDSISEQDFDLIVKTRRTNFHSEKAIKIMETFVIGRLVEDGAVGTQYKRYALTEKTDLGNGKYLMRFCTLYPLDMGYTQDFVPGLLSLIKDNVWRLPCI